MESILNVVKEFIVFPLPNVISMMMLLSGCWWFIKQRPVEKENTAKIIDRVHDGLSDWTLAFQDDRSLIVEALASNSKALEKNERITDGLQLYVDDFNNNCSRLDETLDGILETQAALWSNYNKVTDKMSDMKVSFAVMDERMKDIEQFISGQKS